MWLQESKPQSGTQGAAFIFVHNDAAQRDETDQSMKVIQLFQLFQLLLKPFLILSVSTPSEHFPCCAAPCHFCLDTCYISKAAQDVCWLITKHVWATTVIFFSAWEIEEVCNHTDPKKHFWWYLYSSQCRLYLQEASLLSAEHLIKPLLCSSKWKTKVILPIFVEEPETNQPEMSCKNTSDVTGSPPPPNQTYRDAVALSDVGAEYAGHRAANVNDWHAAAPAVVSGCLTLHAGEAEKPEATLTAEEKKSQTSASWDKTFGVDMLSAADCCAHGVSYLFMLADPSCRSTVWIVNSRLFHCLPRNKTRRHLNETVNCRHVADLWLGNQTWDNSLLILKVTWGQWVGYVCVCGRGSQATETYTVRWVCLCGKKLKGSVRWPNLFRM